METCALPVFRGLLALLVIALPTGCATQPQGASTEENFGPDDIVYSLPKTQFRLTGTMSATITGRNESNAKYPYTIELAWESPAISLETIPDPDHVYALPGGRQGMFSSKEFGLELTPEGFPSEGNAVTTDHVVPFITAVLKTLTLGATGSFANVWLSKSDHTGKDLDVETALSRLETLRGNLVALEEELVSLKVPHNAAIEEVNRVAARQKVLAVLKEETLAAIVRAKGALRTERKMNLALLPDSQWKQSDGTGDGWKKTLTFAELGFPKVPTAAMTFELKGDPSKLFVTEAARGDGRGIFYRVPLACRLNITLQHASDSAEESTSGAVVVVDQLPVTVNQYGIVRKLSTEAGLLRSRTVTLAYHPTTGGLKKVSNSTSGGIVSAAGSVTQELAAYGKARNEAASATGELALLKAETEILELKVKKMAAEEALGLLSSTSSPETE